MELNENYQQFREQFSLLSMEPLKKYTTFRVGGPADLLAVPGSVQQLKDLLKAARQRQIPVTILGGGANTLVSDEGIRGLVLVLKRLRARLDVVDAHKVMAFSGESLAAVVRFSSDQGLSGLEFATGIPGTIGGAVIMNAGTKDKWMSHVLSSIDVMDPESLEVETIPAKDLRFEYRKLDLPGKIIISVMLDLVPGDPGAIKEKIQAHQEQKRLTQPIAEASAGCFFKNPSPDKPAGKLIEEAGLKGMELNGAKVSDLHANFIVNTGNASCKDILALSEKVKQAVFETFNITLETEIKVTGHE